ncbi:MAG: hypothetical protein Q9M15_07905 [Mariprofundaceae bacterium]|nr:hypothetical protein [Mariprofundaceae bacterium]
MVSVQHPQKIALLSDYISPLFGLSHAESGRLKKQAQLERKLTRYILQDYRPFDLFIRYLMQKYNFSKNKLAQFLPGESDLEHKQRKLDKWCRYRAWGEKKGDPYHVKDMQFLLNEIEADNDTQIIFVFMILIDQIYIPEMITLPQRSWKDLYP